MIFKREKQVTLHKCERKKNKNTPGDKKEPLVHFLCSPREGRERERDSFYARSFTTLKLTEGFAACEKKAPAICPILKNYPMQRRNDVIEHDMAMVFQIWSKLTGRLTSQ